MHMNDLDASPDHRYIRQAPVKKLDRKISIPKSHLGIFIYIYITYTPVLHSTGH